jgi:NADH dehydrogenase
MTEDVVVLGSGYAGTGAVKRLERDLDGEADITWVSDVDHHLVLHESHRIIRDPAVQRKITFDVAEIKAPTTRFLQGRVTDIDADERTVTLADDSIVPYDFLLVGFGSRTAFFGIEGLETQAFTLKSLEDALDIHEAVTAAARDASREAPARIVIGGAGLSGIQSAGEIAAFRDDHRAPIEIHLVEGLDSVFPNNDPVVQAKLRTLLEAKGVEIHTGEFVGAVDEDTVYVGDETELGYDVLLWTGGITGREAAERVEVATDERSHRLEAAADFRTSDDRIFAIGDAAVIEQADTGHPTTPTAQAAWQAAEVAGENIARAIRDQPLKEWQYDDKGTLISVGDKAVAHDVKGLPVDTFGGYAAKALKKTVAAQWIRTVNGFADAAKAFPDM